MALTPDAKNALIAFSRFGLGARSGNVSGDFAKAAADPRGFLKAELDSSKALIASPELMVTRTNLVALYADQEETKRRREANLTAAPKSGGPALANMAPALGVPAASAPAVAMNAGSMNPGSMNPGGMNPGTMNAPAMNSGANDMMMPKADMAMQPRPDTAKMEAGKVDMAKPDAAKRKLSMEQEIFRSEALARFQHAIAAEAGLIDRLVWFWSNHFCVSVAKSQFSRVTAGNLEREAIRPHVLGHFGEMLKAVEQHPAMLHYLDNQQSVGPNSKAGQNRKKGLNENLAREIMELHSLGVGGGYSQADVTSLARIITGWSVHGREVKNAEPGTFAFNANAHEPGDQTVLGKVYAANGIAQGEAVLSDLARHKATAKHIAFKLARHFVADVPPASLVERLSQVFLQSDGDLKAVTLALLDADEAWNAPLTKLRSPAEFLVAVARATGRNMDDPGQLLNGLNALGQPLWQPSGPNGFGDTVDTWASAEGMKLRLDVASNLARQVKDLGNPLDVLDAVSGAAASSLTKEAIARAESKQQGFAILLMSPEFQRR